MNRSEKRILCVDGDPDTCRMLATLLSRNYETKTASTLGEAVRLAATRSFDLSIIEGGFSDGTGLELCRMLRAAMPSSPVVFFTNDPHQPARDEVIAAGGYERVEKPHLERGSGSIKGCQCEIVAVQKQAQTYLLHLLRLGKR